MWKSTTARATAGGKQIMNPTTIVHLAEGAQMEMETTQIAGVDDTIRKTSGDLARGASLVIHEKIMTTGDQHAVTDFDVDLNGEGCSANVVSRSVAKDESKQEFISHINGNCACARPFGVRRHHHGPRLGHRQPGPDRQQRGRQPHP